MVFRIKRHIAIDPCIKCQYIHAYMEGKKITCVSCGNITKVKNYKWSKNETS